MARPKIDGLKKKITLGYDPKTGKTVRKWIHAANERALLLLEIKEQENFELSKRAGTSSTKFGPYAARWIELHHGDQERATRDMYYYSLKRCMVWENRDMREITQSDILALLNSLTPSCAAKTRLLIRGVFASAYADGIITVNPAAGKLTQKKATIKQTLPVPEKRSLTTSERNSIKTAKYSDPRDELFIYIIYYCGLRRSEALALQVKDFDLEKKELHIYKALDFGEGGQLPKIKSTKTGLERNVPLPDQFIPYLEKVLAPYKKDPERYLFQRHAGGLYTHSTYRRMWERIVKAANLDGITAHTVRHNFCSALAYANLPGLSMMKRAEICGHTYETFVRVYLHVDEEKESMQDYSDRIDL